MHREISESLLHPHTKHICLAPKHEIANQVCFNSNMHVCVSKATKYNDNTKTTGEEFQSKRERRREKDECVYVKCLWLSRVSLRNRYRLSLFEQLLHVPSTRLICLLWCCCCFCALISFCLFSYFGSKSAIYFSLKWSLSLTQFICLCSACVRVFTSGVFRY